MRSKDGDRLVMHYTGYLYSNCSNVFESSREPVNRPYNFVLGAGTVIPGWERNLRGMCVGEKRELIVPANYAYGPYGQPGKIPPNAAIIFDVELMGIGDRPKKHKVKREKNKDRLGFTKGMNTEELNRPAAPPEAKDAPRPRPSVSLFFVVTRRRARRSSAARAPGPDRRPATADGPRASLTLLFHGIRRRSLGYLTSR